MRNRGKLTAGFIITGPNIASQDLLFEQLSERVRTTASAKFVRLRAADAPNLKAALKKIIRDSTVRNADEDEDEGLEVTQGVGRFILQHARGGGENQADLHRGENTSTMTWRLCTLSLASISSHGE